MPGYRESAAFHSSSGSHMPSKDPLDYTSFGGTQVGSL